MVNQQPDPPDVPEYLAAVGACIPLPVRLFDGSISSGYTLRPALRAALDACFLEFQVQRGVRRSTNTGTVHGWEWVVGYRDTHGRLRPAIVHGHDTEGFARTRDDLEHQLRRSLEPLLEWWYASWMEQAG